MRKVVSFISFLGNLVIAKAALAQVPSPATSPIQVKPPKGFGIDPATPIGSILTSVITVVFIAAALLVLFMLIVGAFNWILSGGEKDKIENARKRIFNALIGLAILALAFLILNVVGSFLNINILGGFTIPMLGNPPQ